VKLFNNIKMAIQVISAKIKIPQYLYTESGKSYTGSYIIKSNPLQILAVDENKNPLQLFFRNTLLQSNLDIKLTNLEDRNKNLKNIKETIEKILTFTNSK